MITSAGAFIDYFGSIWRRTLNYVRAIPPERVNSAPNEGEFTCGDLVRRLAAAEKMKEMMK